MTYEVFEEQLILLRREITPCLWDIFFDPNRA